MSDKKISALTAKASSLDNTDEFVIAEDDGSGGYVSKKITGAEIREGLNLNPDFFIELIDVQTVDFYAPFDMSIDTTTIITSPTTTVTIELNSSAYTLGSSISAGDKITVTSVAACLVRLDTTKN